MRVTQNAFFSLLTHTKQLSLMTLCNTTAGIRFSFWKHVTDTQREHTEGQTDMEVEIII